MRPARKGPENRSRSRADVDARMASMRPARKGPENIRRSERRARSRSEASMRPARKGPENIVARLPGDPPATELQ